MLDLLLDVDEEVDPVVVGLAGDGDRHSAVVVGALLANLEMVIDPVALGYAVNTETGTSPEGIVRLEEDDLVCAFDTRTSFDVTLGSEGGVGALGAQLHAASDHAVATRSVVLGPLNTDLASSGVEYAYVGAPEAK